MMNLYYSMVISILLLCILYYMLYIIFIFELFILYFSYYIILYSYVFYVPRSDAARAFSMVKALHLALLVDSSLIAALVLISIFVHIICVVINDYECNRSLFYTYTTYDICYS